VHVETHDVYVCIMSASLIADLVVIWWISGESHEEISTGDNFCQHEAHLSAARSIAKSINLHISNVLALESFRKEDSDSDRRKKESTQVREHSYIVVPFIIDKTQKKETRSAIFLPRVNIIGRGIFERSDSIADKSGETFIILSRYDVGSEMNDAR